MMRTALKRTYTKLFTMTLLLSLSIFAKSSITLSPIGTYESGIFDGSAAEIVAHDPKTQSLFVTNSEDNSLDVLDVSNPFEVSKSFSIDLSVYGGGVNSVAVHKGIVAAAVQNENKQAPGMVVLFNTNGDYLGQVTVGALPDMLTFSEDGRWLLVANEGEPNDDYTVDPEGSVSIIDLRFGTRWLHNGLVRTVNFREFNDFKNKPWLKRKLVNPESIRIFGPNATVAQDLEPEYITINKDQRGRLTAWVSLQENNALAKIDIFSARVKKLIGLGYVDHSKENRAFDASDKDGEINITTRPTFGMFQPDAIASYRFKGKPYIITANEGDSRDYDGYSEETRVGKLTLDTDAFPNYYELQQNENLGRLKTTTAQGDIDGDGDFDKIYSYGTRSFSIRSEDGELIYDSKNDFEKYFAQHYPDNFNSTDDENGSMDSRSDDKGIEPEGVVVGKVRGKTYAFIALERIGGIMVYNVTNPRKVKFVQYINTRNFDGDPEFGTAGDLAPEGLCFIPRHKSPIGKPLLAVAFEMSGTTTLFQID